METLTQNSCDNTNTSQQNNFSNIYKLGVVLGKGSYATVRIARRFKDDFKVAVKIVSRAHLKPADEKLFLAEVDIMRSLDHPNIIKVYDFFEEPDNFYLILELLEGGELFERLIEKSSFNEAEARDIAKTLLDTLKYCHDKNLIHRDVKPENILLVSRDNDTQIKLVDFGFAVLAGTPLANPSAGTPGYISPEVLLKKPIGKSYVEDCSKFILI